MIENRFNHEVTMLIAHFRHVVLYGDEEPKTLKGAWKTYLSLKEKNLRPEPTDPKELEKIRETVEIMEKGELSEYNYAAYTAYYALLVDLGMFGTNGLIGDLREEEKKRVSSFSKKMFEILLKKTTPA